MKKNGSAFTASYSNAMPDETPRLSRELFVGLFVVAQALERRALKYALIGGLAAGYRSRPRFTQDVDFLLEIPQLVLPSLLEELKEKGFSFDEIQVIREWTREDLTSVVFNGIQVDWLKPALPLYRHVIDNARLEFVAGGQVRIAAPEGLILTKLVAFRTQDQVDIENLLAANRGGIDLAHVQDEWLTVAELDDPRWKRFQEMIQRLYRIDESD